MAIIFINILRKLSIEKFYHIIGIEAKRVFFSRLDDVIDLPISKACTLTGRFLDSDTKEKQTLFIWILIPNDPQEAIPSTLEQLIENFDVLEKSS